jgi:hypothetical protein
VTVAAKLMYPFSEADLFAIRGPADQLMGTALASDFARSRVRLTQGRWLPGLELSRGTGSCRLPGPRRYTS